MTVTMYNKTYKVISVDDVHSFSVDSNKDRIINLCSQQSAPWMLHFSPEKCTTNTHQKTTTDN